MAVPTAQTYQGTALRTAGKYVAALTHVLTKRKCNPQPACEQ
jgi:hypothetical protein